MQAIMNMMTSQLLSDRVISFNVVTIDNHLHWTKENDWTKPKIFFYFKRG